MEINVCEKCNKEVREEKRGSLTQWIFDGSNCSCQKPTISKVSDQESKTCPKCFNQKVSGRSGSMTQWIFKRYQCICDPEIDDYAAQESSSSARATRLTYEPEAAEVFDSEQLQFPKERYKPLRYIARSAASIVYQCFDRQLGRIVAIKTLLFADADMLVRFQQEAKATALLRHHNIVEVLDFGISGGSAYMVLEFIDATDLEGWIQNNGPFSETDAVETITGVCRALDYAHSKGVYHRDLKPQNILLNKNNQEPKLIDFGLALVINPDQDLMKTQGLSLSGTPSYMSPDQFLGRAYDVRSEIYSLGCVLFACLTGSPPFHGETALEIARKHAEVTPPTLHEANPEREYSHWLEQVIGRCLKKNPADRYASIPELARALQIELSESNHDPTLTAGEINAARNAYESSSQSSFPDEEFAGSAAPVAQPSADIYSQNQKRFETRTVLLLVPLMVLVTGGGLWTILSQSSVESEKPESVKSAKKLPPFTRSALTDFDVGSDLNRLGTDHTRDIMKRNQGVYADTTVTAAQMDLLATAPPSFYYLSFRNCEGVTADILRRLKPMHLKNLRFSISDIDNAGMTVLASLPYLNMVEFEGNLNIDNKGFADLIKSRTLTAIVLRSIKIDGETLRIICTPQMKLLNLSTIPNFNENWLQALCDPTFDVRLDNMNVTDKGMQYVTKLSKLSTICATNLQITDKSVEALSHCLNLYEIELQGNKKITDRAVPSLLDLYERCKTPEYLNLDLSGTSITVKSIPLFKKMKKIKRLVLKNLSGIDSAVIADLRTALPHAKINTN